MSEATQQKQHTKKPHKLLASEMLLRLDALLDLCGTCVCDKQEGPRTHTHAYRFHERIDTPHPLLFRTRAHTQVAHDRATYHGPPLWGTDKQRARSKPCDRTDLHSATADTLDQAWGANYSPGGPHIYMDPCYKHTYKCTRPTPLTVHGFCTSSNTDGKCKSSRTLNRRSQTDRQT